MRGATASAARTDTTPRPPSPRDTEPAARISAAPGGRDADELLAAVRRMVG
jgi:hypothetical protein